MPSRRRRSSPALAAQSAQLAVAVPQVLAHRLTRLALAGAQPSARDRREFQRMGTEKVAAFQESWLAMAAEIVRLQQQFAWSAAQAAWAPWLGAPRARSKDTMQRSLDRVLREGLAPVRRRAVANAARLGRTRLR